MIGRIFFFFNEIFLEYSSLQIIPQQFEYSLALFINRIWNLLWLQVKHISSSVAESDSFYIWLFFRNHILGLSNMGKNIWGVFFFCRFHFVDFFLVELISQILNSTFSLLQVLCNCISLLSFGNVEMTITFSE